jgi:hypothetical protein
MHKCVTVPWWYYSGFHFRPHMGTSSFFAPKDLK